MQWKIDLVSDIWLEVELKMKKKYLRKVGKSYSLPYLFLKGEDNNPSPLSLEILIWKMV